MKRFFLSLTVLAILSVPYSLGAAIPSGSPFRVDWDNAPLKVDQGGKFEATVTIHVPSDHYIYADQTDLDFKSLEGLRIDEIKYPKAEKKEDPYFGKTMDVYTGDVPITIVGHVPETLEAGLKELVAVLRFQGCTPKLCLRPEEYDISFNLDVLASGGGQLPEAEEKVLPVTQAKKEGGLRSLLKSADFSAIMNRGMAVTILVVFLAGIFVSLTPCVWPVIPIILLIIGVESKQKWWKNVLLAATLVIGIILVNAALGLAAALFGVSLGFLFQQRWFLLLVIIFFVLMSLAMFGLFDFAPLQRFAHRLSKLGGKGYRGALLAGFGVGLIASPCASPVLAALLGYVAINQSYLMGLGLLIVFGLGMGLFFIVIGSGFGMLAGRVRSGKWMLRIKYMLGILLLLPAIFYLRSLVRWDGVFEPGADSGRPRIEWVTQYEDGLKFANNSGRPIMMEFYADWCPPCRALEAKFFSRPEIVRLSYRLVPIRVDATVGAPQAEAAAEKYKVMGWPTILFLSPQGEVYEDLTVISYDPQKIESNMREAVIRAR